MYTKMLYDHPSFLARKEDSAEKIRNLTTALLNDPVVSKLPVSIFVAGSIARYEASPASDLDLFLVSESDLTRLDEYELFASIINLNQKLGYPPFCNDGRYLKIYKVQDMIDALGSPADDVENLFTARMLMLLESKPVIREDLYYKTITTIIDNYFRDEAGKGDFLPLFLLNDVKRYWCTLTLNYEQIRLDKNRPWRKKNVNLRFSRKLTTHATLLSILVKFTKCKDSLLNLIDLTPLERLAVALESTNNREYQADFSNFLNNYNKFILAKEDNEIESKPTLIYALRSIAEEFAVFIDKVVHDQSISKRARMYLYQ